MLRNTIIISCLLLLAFTELQAQRRRGWKRPPKPASMGDSRFRHIAGIKGIDFAYGFSDVGQVYRVSGMFYLFKDQSIRTNGYYENGDVLDSPLKRYVLEVDYAYTLLTTGFIYLNLVGGLTGAYDDAEAADILDTDAKLNFGLTGAIELEWFFAANNCLFIRIDQKAYLKEHWGRFRNINVAGIRFNVR